jgi:hypothetical protein
MHPLRKIISPFETHATAAKADSQAKVAAARTQGPALRKSVRAFTLFVRASFGNSPDVLADFGLTPHKAPAPKTVETKANAVAKTLATRQARHTMGPAKKAAIKGTVPASTPSGGAAHAPGVPAPSHEAPAAPAPKPAS